MIYEMRIWNQVKLWSSQLWTEFLRLRKEAWKIHSLPGLQRDLNTFTGTGRLARPAISKHRYSTLEQNGSRNSHFFMFK